MVVDEGTGGIAQSRHHPHAGESAHGPLSADATRTNSETEKQWTNIADELLKRIAGLVIPGKEEEVAEAVKDVIGEVAHETRSPTADETIELIKDAVKEMKKEVKESIKETIAEMSSAATVVNAPQQTWAQTAAAGAPAWEPRLVVPARNAREVIVRAKDTTPDLNKRAPKDTLEAINKAIGSNVAVAARQMPSGDTVVTFREPADKYTEGQWAQDAFGPTAQVVRRELAVLVKGVPTGPLKAAQNLLRELQEVNGKAITKVKPMFRKDPASPRTSMVVHVNDVEMAKTLCDLGLIWEAQIFHCEPYATDLQFRQCFRCYGLGHIARYCSKPARCGCCAGTAHQNGEASCPQKGPNGRKKCVNCGGRHGSWERSCPTAKAYRTKIEESYQHRPRQFVVTGSGSTVPSSGTASSYGNETTPSEEGGWQVSRQRKRRAPGTPPPPPRTRGRPRADQLPLQPARGVTPISQLLQRQGSGTAQTQQPPNTQ
jgi:hypothetical protein